MSDQDDRWRIKEFAAKVGVQEVTLRAWERRYELLRPERTPGGFRLYSKADERRVRSMQAHMERGIAAAQAAALAIAESAAPVLPPAEAGALVDTLLAAAEAFDATRLDAVLDAALAADLAEGIRDVILPTLVQLGVRWEGADISVGQEHFASHLIERRLLTLAQGWEAGNGPLALLACPSGERHTLGLLCFGLVLSSRGWRIAYLGADTPVAEIVQAGASLGPDAVIVCALDATRLTANADALGELGRRHRTMLAGSGASPALARRLRVDYTDGDPVSSAQALADSAG